MFFHATSLQFLIKGNVIGEYWRSTAQKSKLLLLFFSWYDSVNHFSLSAPNKCNYGFYMLLSK